MTTSQQLPTRTERPGGWLWWPVTFTALAWVAPMVLADLPWWAGPVTGGVVAAAGVGLARYQWPLAVYGRDYLRGATLFAVVTGLALGGWLLACHLPSAYSGLPQGPAPLWRWFLGGSALMALWYFVLAWRAPHWAAQVDRRVIVQPAPSPIEQAEVGGVYAEILRNAGVLPAARIVKVERSETGGMDTVHLVPAPAVPGRRRMTFGGLVGKLTDIVTEADLLIDGIDLAEDDVIPAQVSAAKWILYVTVRRVLADPVPYPIRTEPRPVDEPGRYGRYENDTTITMTLTSNETGTSHIDYLAGTGGGKSVGLHGQIAEDVAADCWEVWVFATRKLVPLVWPWLRPWVAGETDRPIIDRVFGEDIREVLTGLAGALQLVTRWNQQLGGADVRTVRPGDAGLTLVLDEASTFLQNPTPVYFELNGDTVKMTASEIFAELSRTARSSQLKLVRAFQDGLFGSGGNQGQIARRNVLAAVVGKVTRQQDASAFMPSMPGYVNCTRLRDNTVWVQPNLDEPTILRAKLWALFAKAAKPDRPAVDHIRPVVLAYTRWRNGLDPADTAHVEGYADRWDRRRHPQLVAAAEREGYRWPTYPAGGAATPDQQETTPQTTSPATPPATPPATAPATPATTPTDRSAVGLTPDQTARLELALRILGEQQDEGARFVREYRAGTLDRTTENIARSSLGMTPRGADTGPASTTPGSTSAPANTPEAPPMHLPNGWDDMDSREIWAALESPGGTPGADQPDQPAAAPSTPSVIEAADTSGIADALRRQAEQEAYLDRLGTVPDPLRQVLLQMLHPRAQKVVATGWVPTEVLAMVIGRVAVDADSSAKSRAVAQLGLELARVTGLRAQEIPRPLQPQLGRKSGWKVEDLRAAGERLMQDAGGPSA